MKQFLITAACCLFSAPAYAEDMKSALSSLVSSSPSLEARIAANKAVETRIEAARALSRPRADFSVSTAFVERDILRDTGLLANRRSVGGRVNVTQPIYTGGRNTAALQAAVSGQEADKHLLQEFEQALLVQGTRAYVNVLLAEELIDIREKNVEALALQERAAKIRFDIGRNTTTDTMQASTGLARARASLVSAQAGLIESRAIYMSVFGHQPDNLVWPKSPEDLPESLQFATDTALRKNPSILAQIDTIALRQAQLDLAKSASRASVSLSTSYGTSENFGDDRFSDDDLTVGLTLDVPLYAGGGRKALRREETFQLAQAKFDLAATRQTISGNVQAAWARWQGALNELSFRRIQTENALAAFDGAVIEQRLGKRSTFEVLNLERNLIEARLSLAFVESDVVVEAAVLLQSVGTLTVETDWGVRRE